MSEVRALYVALTAVLVAGAIAPGPVAAQTNLSYNLTLTGESFSGATPPGGIAGTFGGVAVDGSYARGLWTFAVFGCPFAAGTYQCVHICRFNGTMLAGRPLIYNWTSQVPTWDAPRQVTVGNVGPLFASSRDWATQVGLWAQAKRPVA
ncbi:MAG TPA: hypothetical protein VKW09_13880 [bacterium]|nr:hypothetical protein [bacterium]